MFGLGGSLLFISYNSYSITRADLLAAVIVVLQFLFSVIELL